MDDSSDITSLLAEIGAGGREAVDRLYPLVYAELRRLAQHQISRERSDHTLQATALVHEAYVKMVDQERVEYKGRSHFFAIAAQAMRRILVDHARQRQRKKRGGDLERAPMEELARLPAGEEEPDVVALDEALSRFAEIEPLKARVVEMRFFGGLSNDEVAAVIDVSGRTAERYWQHARAWLYRELAGDRG